MAGRSNEQRVAIALLALRLGAGGMLLLAHGWPKVMMFSQSAPGFADPIGLGPEVGYALVVFAEVVCAALVMLGLFTRLATVPMLVFFFVAAFVQHAASPFAKKELALIYGVVTVAIAIAGPGRFSLDALRGRE